MYVFYVSQKFRLVLKSVEFYTFLTDSFDAIRSMSGSSDNITCCDRTDIAWDSDMDVRFRNPGGRINISDDSLRGTTMPPNWPLDLSGIESGLENESLIVWYRVSAFPIFRKLYGRVRINGDNDAELPKGDYNITITYSILWFPGCKLHVHVIIMYLCSLLAFCSCITRKRAQNPSLYTMWPSPIPKGFI